MANVIDITEELQERQKQGLGDMRSTMSREEMEVRRYYLMLHVNALSAFMAMMDPVPTRVDLQRALELKRAAAEVAGTLRNLALLHGWRGTTLEAQLAAMERGFDRGDT